MRLECSLTVLKRACDDQKGTAKVQVCGRRKIWKAITPELVVGDRLVQKLLSPNTPPRKITAARAADALRARCRCRQPAWHYASRRQRAPRLTRARNALNDLSKTGKPGETTAPWLFSQHSDPLKPITNTHRNHVRLPSVK